MRILKKIMVFLNSAICAFNPKKSEDRIDRISKHTKELQDKADNYLKEATMNGEKHWFLQCPLEEHNHKNGM